ncbi:MAG: hypothetical protein FWF24_07640, partial [Alphaproteobacteria bacterium]|nr:hypothetical protein [Alphaproteobacteria bacterium]
MFETFDEDKDFIWSKTIKEDLHVSPEALRDVFSGDWDAVLEGRGDPKQHISSVFLKHGLSLSSEDFISYWLAKDVRLNKSLLPLLDKKHSYIGTNQSLLRALEIERLFSGKIKKVYASCRIGTQKPSAGFYAFIEKDLNLPPPPPPHKQLFCGGQPKNKGNPTKRGGGDNVLKKFR